MLEVMPFVHIDAELLTVEELVDFALHMGSDDERKRFLAIRALDELERRANGTEATQLGVIAKHAQEGGCLVLTFEEEHGSLQVRIGGTFDESGSTEIGSVELDDGNKERLRRILDRHDERVERRNLRYQVDGYRRWKQGGGASPLTRRVKRAVAV